MGPTAQSPAQAHDDPEVLGEGDKLVREHPLKDTIDLVWEDADGI